MSDPQSGVTVQAPPPEVSDDIFRSFGLETEGMSFLAEAPEEFLDAGATFPLQLDKKVMFMAEINGKAIQCFGTLRSARLTHLSLHERMSITNPGQVYWQTTGAIANMGVDLGLILDNKEYSIQEFLCAWVNSELPPAKRISVQQFEAQADRLRLHYAGTMPMFVYHPGTDLAKYKAFIDTMRNLGAVDNIGNITDPRTIRESWNLSGIEGGGLNLTSIEIGTTDRSQSATNQGFQDLVSAQIEHFQRVVKLRKAIKAMRDDLEEKVGGNKLKEEQVKAARDEISTLSDASVEMNRRASWGGTQEGHVQAADGSRQPDGKWYSVNVPCGRMALIDPSGREIDLDLWSRGTQTANTGGSAQAVDTTVVDTSNPEATKGEGEPF